MRLEDLDYDLPEGLIAQHPAQRREDARLLVVERASGRLQDSHVRDIGRWLRAGDALALNETRVRPARLRMRRPSGGAVEVLVVRPEPDGHWRVLARPGRGARVGGRIESSDGRLVLEVLAVGEEGERVVRIVRGDLDATMRQEGELPLPPYVRRPPGSEDLERYQTVFARIDGAVAAPTAGLHFTTALLADLGRQGVAHVPLLLHVGPGTFRPVSAADPRDHRMGEEWFELTEEAAVRLNAARAAGGRIVAVGTTAVRTLESACDAHGGALSAARGWTRKFIHAPYAFQAVDALMTNFHLPRTTLLLLVGAFAGGGVMRAAYAHAIREQYRFYSYGDAMLVV